MTPEELEAFRGWCLIYEMPPYSLIMKALEHIHEQDVRIAELESQIIQQTGISANRMEERERLQKQIAALQEIAINERERRHISVMGRFGFVLDSETSPDPRKLAEDQLAKEHPEAFQ